MTTTPNPTAERWRKKPVEIEAMRYDGENWVEIAQWLRVHDVRIGQTGTRKASIPTLEGTMYASPGDWIIKGVQGEFYPCKPDIFEQTYERAALVAATAGVVPQEPLALDPEKVAEVFLANAKSRYGGLLFEERTAARIARALCEAYMEGKLT